MMFSRIALIASFLFFLIGTNGFASSNLEKSTPKFESVQTNLVHNKSTLTMVTVSNKNTTVEAANTIDTKNKTENAGFLTKKNQRVEPSIKDYIIPATVCLLLFLGLCSYWLVFRRKHV